MDRSQVAGSDGPWPNHLDLTVDYGWLWFIAQPLFQLLQTVFTVWSRTGVSPSSCITLPVRGIMFPLTKAQYTSMAKMRMLQPKLTAPGTLR